MKYLRPSKHQKPKAVASDPEIKTEMQKELRSFLQDLKKPKPILDTPAAANDGQGAFSNY